MAQPRITKNVERVAAVIREAGRASGAEIARQTALFTGTLYPLLLRLEGAGWLSSEWEAGDPKELGRPRRRFYSVTAKGQEAIWAG